MGEPLVIRTWDYGHYYVPTSLPITQLQYSEAQAALYEEAMTITYIVLDTLRRDMLVEAGNRYSVPADRLQRLIEFTTKLHTLLVSEVVGAKFYYKPRNYDHNQYIWGRSVYGGDIGISVDSTSLYWRAGGKAHKVGGIQEMVTSMREYVEGTRMELEVHNYCKGCWFSDMNGQYCGVGRPLSLDCMDYIPIEGV